MIELDGRTGEGGGQLVRIAVGLAALTTQDVKLNNIRGNRPKPGLGRQHVTSIKWLAEATNAEVEGLRVGSKDLTFKPRRKPVELKSRKATLSVDFGAGSVALILQAILPFLVFAGSEDGEPVSVELKGGTNASFSPSFEYLDHVLFPALEERFRVNVDRELKKRGWSMGAQSQGAIALTIHPLAPGAMLNFVPLSENIPGARVADRIDITILAPEKAHKELQKCLKKDLKRWFPQADTNFGLVEDSERDSRWYVLLVARSENGEVRWARDILTSLGKKWQGGGGLLEVFVKRLSDALTRELRDEVELGGALDIHLQDQLILFQALCEGQSSMPRHSEQNESESTEKAEELGLEKLSLEDMAEAPDEPFGHGSLHAKTARWVCHKLLPGCRFLQQGDMVKGVGFSIG